MAVKTRLDGQDLVDVVVLGVGSGALDADLLEHLALVDLDPGLIEVLALLEGRPERPPLTPGQVGLDVLDVTLVDEADVHNLALVL